MGNATSNQLIVKIPGFPATLPTETSRLFLIRTHRPRTPVVLAILMVLVTLILTLSSAASYLEPVLRVLLGGLACRA